MKTAEQLENGNRRVLVGNAWKGPILTGTWDRCTVTLPGEEGKH